MKYICFARFLNKLVYDQNCLDNYKYAKLTKLKLRSKNEILVIHHAKLTKCLNCKYHIQSV